MKRRALLSGNRGYIVNTEVPNIGALLSELQHVRDEARILDNKMTELDNRILWLQTQIEMYRVQLDKRT